MLTGNRHRFTSSTGPRQFAFAGVEDDIERGNAPESAAYSRNPGFTDTRLRPFARRRDKTAWPDFVFMRVRNPWVLLRLRRLG